MQQNYEGSHAGRLTRWGEFIGDLANPFYREERQRDVWNEASAVGLQLLLWSGLIASTAMVWIGGRTAVPYVATYLILIGVSSLVTVAYAGRLGVALVSRERLVRARMVPYLLLVVLLVVGMVRATGASVELGTGILTGLVVAGIMIGLAGRRGRLDRD